MFATTDTQFYMNNRVGDEGDTFARIAHAANWPLTVVAVHKSLRNDGLVEAFNSHYVDELGLFSITVEYDGTQTPSALLIDIQKVLTSKLEEVTLHLLTICVILR